MAKSKVTSKKTTFLAKAETPPKQTDQEWFFTSLLGLLFVVMAILQLASFNDFKDALSNTGFSNPTTWGTLIIAIELWASAAFFKLRLSTAFRRASGFFALVVSGFWFYESIRVVSDGMTLTNSGYFGRFLALSPDLWTTLAASVVLAWTLWAVERTQR